MRKETNPSEQATLEERLAGLERSLSRAKTEYHKKTILAEMERVQQQLADQSQIESGPTVETVEETMTRLLRLATTYVEANPEVAIPNNKVTYRSVTYTNLYLSQHQEVPDPSEKQPFLFPQIASVTGEAGASDLVARNVQEVEKESIEGKSTKKKRESPVLAPEKKKIILKTKEKKSGPVAEAVTVVVDESTWQTLALIFHSLRRKNPQIMEDFFWALGESNSEAQTINLLREYASFLGPALSSKVELIVQAYRAETLSYEEIRKRFFQLKG